MDKYKVELETRIKPEEVLYVREESIKATDIETWQVCLEQALCVVGARNDAGQLVGVGFLVGNLRHGEIVDLSVHSSHRRNKIAAKIMEELIGFARKQKIVYLGLTYDKNSPWLKGFYEKFGFREIDFGMWHESSLGALFDPAEMPES